MRTIRSRLTQVRYAVCDALEFVSTVIKPNPNKPMDVARTFRGHVGEFAPTMVVEGSDFGALTIAVFSHCTLWMLGQARERFGRFPLHGTQRYKFDMQFKVDLKKVEVGEWVDEGTVLNCDEGVRWVRNISEM